MPFVCYDCQIIFSRKYTNCPYCGGRVLSSDSSQDALIHEGFSLARLNSERNRSNQSQANISNTPDNSDIFASLRESYQREHEQSSQQPKNRSTNNPPSQESIPPRAQEADVQPTLNSRDNNDFFARSKSQRTIQSIPTISNSSVRNTTPISRERNTNESRSALIERQQRRIRNNYRRASLGNLFDRINWKTVLWIILILVIVACVVTVWKMRYVILNSIMNFAISLIPLVLVVWIIVHLIKSIFK